MQVKALKMAEMGTHQQEEKQIQSVEDGDENLDRLLESINSSQPCEAKTAAEKLVHSTSSKSLKSILKRRGASATTPDHTRNHSQTKMHRTPGGSSYSSTKEEEINAPPLNTASISSMDSILSDSKQGLPSSMRKTNSQVSFSSVGVREYDRTLGDNPACISGPPISLDWSYSKESEICMEEYEKMKYMKKGKNRNIKNVRRIGKAKRVNLLQNHLGFTEDEIEAATREGKSIQRGRAITKAISPLWRLEDAAQSAGRKVKKALSKGHKSEGDLDELQSSISGASITLDISSSSSTVHPTLEF